jgi:hypothetical protein
VGEERGRKGEEERRGREEEELLLELKLNLKFATTQPTRVPL